MLNLAKLFVENYKFTIVVTVFVVLFGWMGATQINSEKFPSVNIGAVQITTAYDGATAEDIETKITKPIEEEIQKITGLKKVKSISQSGLSKITTEVDIDNYPVEEVISDIQRAVDGVTDLPSDLRQKPTFLEIKSDEFPVIELAVIGSNENRLRDRVADQLKEDLEDNKKVSNVTLTGFRERQFNILLDHQKLDKFHVSIQEVQNAIKLRNQNFPGGEIKSEKTQKLVRVEGKAKSKEEIENIVVRSNFTGQQVLLKDIAEIDDSSEESTILTSIDGKASTMVTVTKKGGADIIKLSKEVEDQVALYQSKYKGELDFVIFNHEGIRVQNRLQVLLSNGWQGMFLVFFFLLLFLPGRIGIVTGLSLPLALFSTLSFIMIEHYTLNTITIIALIIAIGMLVDNAVVISENYTRLRDEGMDTNEALTKTIGDLWIPVTATALTTISAFLPMLVTSGVMGQFIRGIPIVVSVALLLSLFESFFLLPMRLKLVNYQPKTEDDQKNKKGWFDRVLVPRFEVLMTYLVKHKGKSALFYLATLFFTFFSLGVLNQFNLFPADQTEIYLARLEMPQGTRVEAMEKVTDELMLEIQNKFPDYFTNLASTSGRSSSDFSDPKTMNGANTAIIRMFSTHDTQISRTTKSVLDDLRTIKNEKLVRLTFEALVNGPPVGDPVSVTFRSNNPQELEEVVKRITEKLSAVPGIFDTKVDDVFGDDEIRVVLDYNKAARLGLSLSDVGNTIRTAISGQVIQDVNLNNREVEYFLRMQDQDKQNIEDLRKLKVSDQKGNLIPLSTVAQFEAHPGSPQIKRYDFKRARTVLANLDDTVITSIQANQIVQKEYEALKNQYKEVSMVFGGEAEKTKESVGSLFRALILSLIGIFALLVLIFRSFLSPFIILTTIPLGLVGISLAFFIHQRPLSFMALVGIIGLGGIIVNSGIILISFIEQMKQESSLSLQEILVKASVLRLRAVLVTSLTTISGLVPTAYGIGGSDAFIIPMALALAWGLSTGTILTLLWVPPAYGIVESIRENWKQWNLSKIRMLKWKKKDENAYVS